MMYGSSRQRLVIDTRVIAKDLIKDPSFLAYKFNFDSECVAFLPIERDEIRQVTCLKLDYIDSNRKFIEVPLAEVIGQLDSEYEAVANNPPRFIFRTAFCASTFLSRCLDVEGISTSLREPQLLLDAANAKRLQWHSRSTKLDYQHLPRIALALLQKHAVLSEKLIIKPINSVNNIIPELLKITAPSKSLILYTDARNFILSTLKKGEGGKQTIRSMFDLIRCDFPHLSNLQLTHTIHMTDLRVIMTLWRLQIEQAEETLQQFLPEKRMASLYGENLIRSALGPLQAINQYLELGISFEQISAIVNSENRLIDAKNMDEKFSVQNRKSLYERLESFYGDDLDDGLQWLARNNPGTKLVPDLSAALHL